MNALPIGCHLLGVVRHANELAVLCSLVNTAEGCARGRVGLEDMANQVRSLEHRVSSAPQSPGVYKDMRRVRSICRSIFRSARAALDAWELGAGIAGAQGAGSPSAANICRPDFAAR